jgi:hypothetical protein
MLSINGETFTIDDVIDGYAKLRNIVVDLYNFIDNHINYNTSLVYDHCILSRVRFIDDRVEVTYHITEDIFELVYNIDYICSFTISLEVTSAVLGRKVMEGVIPYYVK